MGASGRRESDSEQEEARGREDSVGCRITPADDQGRLSYK